MTWNSSHKGGGLVKCGGGIKLKKIKIGTYVKGECKYFFRGGLKFKGGEGEGSLRTSRLKKLNKACGKTLLETIPAY